MDLINSCDNFYNINLYINEKYKFLLHNLANN